MKRTLLYITMLLGLAGFAAGCSDEIDVGGPIGEGVATVSAELAFTPFEGALDGRSAGDALKPISSVSIAIFDPEGKLVSDGVRDIASPSDPGSVPGNDTESTVGRRKFTIDNIPFGRYRIYAIVNMPGFAAKYGGNIATVDDLLSIPLTWNASDVKANGQMLGYFTAGRQDAPPADFEAPAVAIDRERMELHAYVRRAASKLTVAFDGSRLNENVWIYIKSATVRDIPATCLLGKDNVPSEKAHLIAAGESMLYPAKPDVASTDDYNTWLRISKNVPAGGSDHSEKASAVYFYENMQGVHADCDKRQDPDKVNNGIVGEDHPDWKDKIAYGSYVEVEGYYYATAPTVSRGKIKYRFMLGKNVSDDYNAQRNHHYKLTLRFNGTAKDVDWHIEYEEPKNELIVPDNYYISYLYNQSLSLPVTATGVITSLQADIIENNWAPYDPSTSNGVPKKDDNGPFPWYYDAWSKYKNQSDKGNYLGFLSLRKAAAGEETIVDGPTPINQSPESDKFLKEFYDSRQKGSRDYTASQWTDMSPGSSVEIEGMTVSRDGETFHFGIPLYTRAKQLVPATAFTGNNPYDSYRRKAVVKFTAKFANGETKTAEVPIYQVRRIVNPKGVWRSAGNQDAFHVRLTHLMTPDARTFTVFDSEGPWRAEVEVDPSNLVILSKDGVNPAPGNVIEGVTGSPVDFYYKPNGIIGSDQVRCAVIKVTYHNNTCVHKIFVRQGYNQALDVAGDGTKWSSFNLYAKGTLTKSPLALGSMFKRGNYDDAILESNNDTYGLYADVNSKSLKLASGGSKKWNNITYISGMKKDDEVKKQSFDGFSVGERQYDVPTFDEYNRLKQNSQFGYGVLYGDGATETALDVKTAYGYRDDGNNGVKGANGMRGCIVYNPVNANQVFFPLGSHGYGRRVAWISNPGNESGVLRYGDVSALLSNTDTNKNNIYRPIVYNLRALPGAIYWIKQPDARGHSSSNVFTAAWDLNYFSFEFGPYTQNCLGNTTTDALPIKLVRKK